MTACRQMAEGLARQLARTGFEVASAGTYPVGMEDLRRKFDYLITFCDAAAEGYPVLLARRAAFARVREDLERRLRGWRVELHLLGDAQ